MLHFESIWLVFLKLAATKCYLELGVTQGEQTRVDRRRLVTAVALMSTEAYCMWWTKYCELFRPLLMCFLVCVYSFLSCHHPRCVATDSTSQVFITIPRGALPLTRHPARLEI